MLEKFIDVINNEDVTIDINKVVAYYTNVDDESIIDPHEY